MTTEPTFDRYQRWRLILGKRVEGQTSAARCAGGAGQPGEATLTREMQEMDEALGALYDVQVDETRPEETGRRGASLGKGKGRLAKWLGDVRKHFERDVVVMIQKDAMASNEDLRKLMLEPELLGEVTPSIEMVATILSLKDEIPDKAKAAAREIVAAVVEEIRKRLAPQVERAVRGALSRTQHQPIPSLPNLDWKRTIQGNLKNYVADKKTIIPDRFFFWARQQRRREWNVIVCMDQSGSMAESVVYGSVMGAIFASIPALETHVVAFDTEVVDLTADCTDPVDLLFGIQLGGGTDINRAVGYCQGLVRDPRKTLFILLTDLYEGGNARALVRRMADMVASGTRAVCLLALSDSGVPSYDERLARELANVGVPCFASTPGALPDVLEAMLRGRDVRAVAEKYDTSKKA